MVLMVIGFLAPHTERNHDHLGRLAQNMVPRMIQRGAVAVGKPGRAGAPLDHDANRAPGLVGAEEPRLDRLLPRHRYLARRASEFLEHHGVLTGAGPRGVCD